MNVAFCPQLAFVIMNTYSRLKTMTPVSGETVYIIFLAEKGHDKCHCLEQLICQPHVEWIRVAI